MDEHEPDLLTVAEAASRLRLTSQTLYRWCRSGRIIATKIGKEWRIPAASLSGDRELTGLMPLPDLLRGLSGRSGHVLGVAADAASLASMEAKFFEMAAFADGRMVRIAWGEKARAVRERLRPALGKGGKGNSHPRVLQFRDAYEANDVTGTARLLLEEIRRAAGNRRACYVYGSPASYFGSHLALLAAFESGMDIPYHAQSALALCGYALGDLTERFEGRALPLLMDLLDRHAAVIWYDGRRALLHRTDAKTARRAAASYVLDQLPARAAP